MVKKLLKKIKEFLFGKKQDINKNATKCPYKIEPKQEVHTIEEIESTELIEEIEEDDAILKCEHCNKELNGKESSKDEQGAYYIWCKSCNYVNKIKDGKVIRKDNNAQEVMKAFKLFKKAGHIPSSYAVTSEGERNSFK